ncbi:MAG: NAD-dependent epimerase/dehydratase family protein [Isosphaeraceae bacterium]
MGERALVTGGGGFLGGAIVSRLVERGDSVRSLARNAYPDLQRLGVETIQGDVADASSVRRAVSGCDVVYHVAAKAGVWGPFAAYHHANVEGTRQIIAACREQGVARLVYTSSPSVVFHGRDMENVDESVPYPNHFKAAYPATKAEAERLVRAANSPTLATVSLRTHLIWGPGDNHLIPRILARARAGRLRRIGRADKRIDATYIDNAADAHILAADRLAPGSSVAGKVYFIAQGEPMPLWSLVNAILDAAGLPPVEQSVPAPIAAAGAGLLELVYRALRRTTEPPLTRFVVRELATAHWFNLDAARRDLGYQARVSTEEGLARLADWFRSTAGTPV